MTGYGRATAPIGGSTLTVQVSSVNRKTLDLTVSLPEAWEALEPMIGELARKYASRGKVHVDVELTGAKQDGGPSWDETTASLALDRLAAFAAQRGVPFQPTPQLLWEIVNAQRNETELPGTDAVQSVVAGALEEALKAFAQMRSQEGKTLLTDFLARVSTLSGHVVAIAQRAPEVPKNYREQLMSRLRQAGLELDLQDERVLKEVALFADRCDIAEELTRLRSHLEQFGTLLQGDAEIGRKAEFILQEIGREIHTIGSKANDLEISRRVIDFKNELERVREQIANVE